MPTWLSIVIAIIGAIVMGWPAIKGGYSRLAGIFAGPVVPAPVHDDEVDLLDILDCVVDLRKLFAKDPEAVRVIDEVLVPSAVKLTSEER